MTLMLAILWVVVIGQAALIGLLYVELHSQHQTILGILRRENDGYDREKTMNKAIQFVLAMDRPMGQVQVDPVTKEVRILSGWHEN